MPSPCTGSQLLSDRVVSSNFTERFLFLAVVGIAILRASCDAGTLPLQARSPDGKNLIELTGLGEQTNGLGIKISRSGRPLIDITSFTVPLAEGGELSGAATLENIERSKIDEKFTMPWGKTKEVINRCERATAHLSNRLGTRWDIDLAAFDNGVSFR